MNENPQQPMDLDAADAAACVKRTVPELDEDGTPTGKEKAVAVKPAEVFANRVREGEVTVITIDGQRLTGKAPAAKTPADKGKA